MGLVDETDGLFVDDVQRTKVAASLANAFALILLPFMRDMIPGSTPGHVLTKPMPGTGAGYLVSASHLIFTGKRAPAMSFPTNKDEVKKVLTSVLSSGQPVVFFDNVAESLASDALASAMTDRYSDRLLGGNRTVDIDVRCQWVFTANNIRMSGELMRRCMMVELDARMASPESRTEFKNGDIIEYVRAHRGRPVWACLTVIQNWIDKGQQKWVGRGMANYRPHE